MSLTWKAPMILRGPMHWKPQAEPTGFAFRRSVSFNEDGDKLSCGSTSTWNPLDPGAFGFSCWARAPVGAFNNNDFLWYASSSSDSSLLGFSLSGTDAVLTGKTRNVGFTGTHVISSATQAAWNMYSMVSYTSGRGGQIVLLYINGVQVDSFGLSNNTFTHSTVDLKIGGPFLGYICEMVFCNYQITAPQLVALYNSGNGADPTTVLDSVHSYYPVSEAAGQTSGTIADAIGNQDLTMSGFSAPYGTITDTP